MELNINESDALIEDHVEDSIEENIPLKEKYFPKQLKLALFSVGWLLMFVAFPFWVYSFRIPLLRDEIFTNIFTFVFFFFSFFSWVIFLVNHFSPVAATIELILPSQEIQSADIRGKKVTVGVASIFCREKLFHVTRNFIGIANSWYSLSVVLDQSINSTLGDRTQINYIHYVLDNTGSRGCLSRYLRQLIRFLKKDPKFCHRIAPGLSESPVTPTEEEYHHLFPKDLRNVIGEFLVSLSPDEFDIFSPISELSYEKVQTKYGAIQKRKYGQQQETISSDSISLDGQSPKKKGYFLNEDGKIQICCQYDNISQCCYDREDISFRVGKLNIIIAVLNATNALDRGKAASLIHCAKVMKNEFPNDVNFLTIFDARHMITPKFWERTIPQFFRGKREITSLRWVQVMQYFSEVDKKEDYFDRGNFFNYLYANSLRDQIRSTTSCGTNALWSMRDHCDGEPFSFRGETKIEETSHHCFTYGEDSIYIAERLVFGSVKDPVEYGEAPSRWAAGAIQLCGVEARRSWLMILSIFSTYFFLPFLLSFVIYFVERSHFIVAAIELVILGSLFIIAPLFRLQKQVARYLIRMVNVSYWFQGPILAIYWMNVLPILLLVAPSFPVKLDVRLMLVGSVLILFLQWVVTSITKSWSGAKEIHIWRSQQVWYSLWPLMFAGIPSLCTGGKMWSISSNQSIFTFVINSIQILTIIGACIYAIIDIKSKIQYNQNQIQFQDLSLCGSRIMGIMFSILSLALILPITISLIFMICGSRNSRGIRMSMRHLQLIFLIIVLSGMMSVVGINWNEVLQMLSNKYSSGFPIWAPPTYG